LARNQKLSDLPIQFLNCFFFRPKLQRVVTYFFQENDLKRKKKRRPVAKYFNSDEIKKIGGDTSTDGDFVIFEGNRYSHKGFLYKTFAINAVLCEGVTPTLSELEKFGETPGEGLDADDVAVSASLVSTGQKVSDDRHNFATGDNVEVCEGELQHLQGKILAMDGNKITIQPKHEDLKVRFS